MLVRKAGVYGPADEARSGTAVFDLTEALRAGVEAAKKTPGGKRGGGPGTAEKAGQAEPARKVRSRKTVAKKAPPEKKAGRRPARNRAA